jgi:hypothetical protein
VIAEPRRRPRASSLTSAALPRPRPRPGCGRSRPWAGLASAAQVAALALGIAACSTPQGAADEHSAAPESASAPASAAAAATDPLGPPKDPGAPGKLSAREHPLQRAFLLPEPGAPAAAPIAVDVAQAEAYGYTILDLGDDWAPHIFSRKTPGVADDAGPNAYRDVYVGLADDRVDERGQALAPWAHNGLELYGIPPSPGALQRQWQRARDEIQPCLTAAGFDPSVFEGGPEVIAFDKRKAASRVRSARWARAALDKAMAKAKLDAASREGIAAAATHPKTKAAYAAWRRAQAPVDVIDHAQRRLRCERLFDAADGRGKFEPGEFDFGTHHALARFEKLHNVMGWGHFTAENQRVFALDPEAAMHERLLRALTERAVAAAGVVEDGSAAAWKPDFEWTDAAGERQRLRDMVGEVRDAVVEQAGLATPAASRAWLDQMLALRDPNQPDVGPLIAVRLPPPPSYYGPDMALEAVIDRGDVWYDLPYDAVGNKLGQPRKRYPHLTVYVRYEDQRIPLVHWRTTIGAWRRELDEGQLYLKYKNSDVGDRVWKHIVAAPVWIPPPTTPPNELLKRYADERGVRTAVNYDETGPGFRSAYGLVAAYHIRQVKDAKGEVLRELDYSIRTHGSVDYMSILRRYSHGCHRLYNMSAVRLFSFVLAHRSYTRVGQEPIGYRRAFEWEGQPYTMRLDTRGYKYELLEPIPVTVTEGTVRGRRTAPIEEYVRIPGHDYDAIPTIELPGEPGEDGETGADGAEVP